MKINPYYTHQKYLTKELSKLDYRKPVRVLEFGIGDGSSSIFSDFTQRYSNLEAHSYESDLSWHHNMSKKYATKNYNFHHVDSWDELVKDNKSLTHMYDLVFVDTDPFQSRIDIINLVRNNAKVIILHDFGFYNKGVITDLWSVGNGSFFKKLLGRDFIMEPNHEIDPGTLVLRNKRL